MPKKLVVVGNDHQLYSFENLPYFFRHNDWVVESCESIELAKSKNPDLLIVYAFMDDHVADFKKWTKHPPTIWFCLSKWDVVPEGTKRLHGPILPSQLYAKCMEFIAVANN